MPHPLPLVLGVYGRKPHRRMIAHLRRTNPAGLLLLSRNIENPAQMRALVEEITQRLGRRLIISIDHEGGWVVRFQKGVTAFPGNAALGRAGSPALAHAVGRRMAEELRALGITLNLAPVVDVLEDNYNPGILIRSFGQDAGLCARLGSAFIQGLQDNGVWACAKHFPGKGAARKDAHYALPVIKASRAQITRHLKPFKAAIDADVSSIMSTHMVVPSLHSQPATFSQPIIEGILRRKMGYRGVIISDDLCMGGATTKRSVPQAAQDAFNAGHDLLIVAHDEKAQVQTADVLKAVLDTEIGRSRALESSARIEALIHSPKPTRAAKAAALPAGANLDLIIARKAVQVVRQGAVRLPLKNLSAAPLVIFPDFKEIKDLFCFENGAKAPEHFVKAWLHRWTDASFALAPVATKRSDVLARLDAKIKRAPATIFFCFEAMRFCGQRDALKFLGAKAAKKTAVCLIRNSQDLQLLPAQSSVIDAFGFRNRQLQAALELIFGRGRVS